MICITFNIIGNNICIIKSTYTNNDTTALARHEKIFLKIIVLKKYFNCCVDTKDVPLSDACYKSFMRKDIAAERFRFFLDTRFRGYDKPERQIE